MLPPPCIAESLCHSDQREESALRQACPPTKVGACPELAEGGPCWNRLRPRRTAAPGRPGAQLRSSWGPIQTYHERIQTEKNRYSPNSGASFSNNTRTSCKHTAESRSRTRNTQTKQHESEGKMILLTRNRTQPIPQTNQPQPKLSHLPCHPTQ